jgi:hypothetical protein
VPAGTGLARRRCDQAARIRRRAGWRIRRAARASAGTSAEQAERGDVEPEPERAAVLGRSDDEPESERPASYGDRHAEPRSATVMAGRLLPQQLGQRRCCCRFVAGAIVGGAAAAAPRRPRPPPSSSQHLRLLRRRAAPPVTVNGVYHCGGTWYAAGYANDGA